MLRSARVSGLGKLHSSIGWGCEGPLRAVLAPGCMLRALENQKTEAKIGVHVLNRMTELGRPNFERTV